MTPTKKYLFIANWKNYFTFNQAQLWISEHEKAFATLAKDQTIVVCPSFEAIALCATILKNTPLKLGSQNCSAHNPGPFSGQVLAESLKQLGCSYCIVGHPEVQKECPESPQQLAAKIEKLWQLTIVPILCISQKAQDFDIGQGAQAIRNQLEPILKILAHASSKGRTLIIAFEPLWATDGNSTPPSSYIASQLDQIASVCKRYAPEVTHLKIYGGGVDETNARNLKNIDSLDGFLIGRASTDFQKLQKIVEL